MCKDAGFTCRTSEASARSILLVAEALQTKGGMNAGALKVAEQYIQAFREVARQSTTMLLPANTNDPAAFIAQAVSILKATATHSETGAGTGPGGSSPPDASQPSPQAFTQAAGHKEADAAALRSLSTDAAPSKLVLSLRRDA